MSESVLFICPVCGGEVPAKAAACPHCGADEETGLRGERPQDQSDIYGEEEYEDSLRSEFGKPAAAGGPGKKGLWIAGVAALLLFLWLISHFL